MLEITGGVISRPQKVVVYGPEGIGKTTLAAAFPDPLFIDTEGGTSHLDVKRLRMPDTWSGLVALVDEVSRNGGVCGTLAIDTADWAEQMCISEVCQKHRKGGIEEFGYGKGYVFVAEEFEKLLTACDHVIASGANVLLTAHAKMRKFEQPDEMGAYDRWEMKLSKQVGPLVKEWADMILFCNYKTYVVTGESGKVKAQGGKRVMYTSHHPCWDAKNRHGLPDELDLNFDGLAKVFRRETVRDKLERLMGDSGVTEEQIQTVVAARGRYDASVPVSDYEESFVENWVIKYWDKIVQMIKEGK